MDTSKMTMPNESEAWHENYHSEVEQKRRRAAMPAKFRKLGIDKLDRNSRILDLCCGAGEALDTLYEMGFRDIQGIDLLVPDDVKQDPRFRAVDGDALDTGLPANSFDLILNIHSMHHFATPENVGRFVAEAERLLKPGGRLAIVDFSNSPQIRLAFWFFRQNVGLVTPYLKYFAKGVQEEWHFLSTYLPQWPKVRKILYDGKLKAESVRRTLFYFHLVLRKPK